MHSFFGALVSHHIANDETSQRFFLIFLELMPLVSFPSVLLSSLNIEKFWKTLIHLDGVLFLAYLLVLPNALRW